MPHIGPKELCTNASWFLHIRQYEGDLIIGTVLQYMVSAALSVFYGW